MTRKKTDPDIVALKRAVKALLSMSSEGAVRASVNYIYDTFVAHPSKSTKEHFASRESASAVDDGLTASNLPALRTQAGAQAGSAQADADRIVRSDLSTDAQE